jgi:hypothetical protein
LRAVGLSLVACHRAEELAQPPLAAPNQADQSD